MQPTYNDVTNRQKVYVDYIDKLGNYKLRMANIAIKEAEAAGKWKEVERQQEVFKQVQRDLRLFNRDRASERKKIERMKNVVKSARVLLRGRRVSLSLFSQGWRAYCRLEDRARLAAGDKPFKIKVPKEARTADNFLNIRQTDTVEAVPASDAKNALLLIHWLYDQRYMAKAGSDAQRVLVELYQQFNTVAAESIEDMRTRIAAMRKDTYDVWSLNEILGVQGSAAAKRIEKAGTEK